MAQPLEKIGPYA